jgi:hypothetical protein
MNVSADVAMLEDRAVAATVLDSVRASLLDQLGTEPASRTPP